MGNPPKVNWTEISAEQTATSMSSMEDVIPFPRASILPSTGQNIPPTPMRVDANRRDAVVVVLVVVVLVVVSF